MAEDGDEALPPIGKNADLEKIFFKVLAEAAGNPEQSMQLVLMLGQYLAMSIVSAAPLQNDASANLLEGTLNYVTEEVVDLQNGAAARLMALGQATKDKARRERKG
jgi:hypothetical protein